MRHICSHARSRSSFGRLRSHRSTLRSGLVSCARCSSAHLSDRGRLPRSIRVPQSFTSAGRLPWCLKVLSGMSCRCALRPRCPQGRCLSRHEKHLLGGRHVLRAEGRQVEAKRGQLAELLKGRSPLFLCASSASRCQRPGCSAGETEQLGRWQHAPIIILEMASRATAGAARARRCGTSVKKMWHVCEDVIHL